jgi:hypothetical protein
MITSTEAVRPAAMAECTAHIRVAWLCATVLLLEGYDIAAMGYAVPALVEAWRLPPTAFTDALVASNVGFLWVHSPRVRWAINLAAKHRPPMSLSSAVT